MEQLTLRQWRRLRELTQRQLAEKTGIAKRTIELYEADSSCLTGASYSNLSKIAGVLNIDVSQIIMPRTSEFPK